MTRAALAVAVFIAVAGYTAAATTYRITRHYLKHKHH
jgi:hypothetical protein